MNTLPSRSAVQSPSLTILHPPSDDHLLSDRTKTELLDNMSHLQSELYMKLEECQRQLDYARSYSLEQETQSQLRIEDLERTIIELKSDKARHEGYGESLALKLQEKDTVLADLSRRNQLVEDRLRQSDDRNKTLEDRLRTVEDRFRTVEEELRRGNDREKLTLRENEELLCDLRAKKEEIARLEAGKEAITVELQRFQAELSILLENNGNLQRINDDLRQETEKIPQLTTFLARKDGELTELFEEKRLLEQKHVDLKNLLKQHDEVANKTFEIRFREAEDKINESWRRKTINLDQKIVDLTLKIENMQMELQSRPTNKQVRDLESTVDALEERLERENARKQRRNGSMSVTPTRFRDTGKGEQGVLKRVMMELKEGNVAEVVGRVRELVKGVKGASSAETLVGKLRKLVEECSPQGSFASSPSPKQIWKWIRRVVEDLMRLRTESEGGVLGQIMNAVGVTTTRDAYNKVAELVGEMERIKGGRGEERKEERREEGNTAE